VSQQPDAALLLTYARRGEEAAIRKAIGALREDVPDARIEAIGTPVSAPVLRELGVENLIVYGAGQGTLQVIRQARARRFAAAALVYSGPRFSGHLKLEAVALLAGVKRAYRCGPQDQAVPVGRLRIAFSVFVKGLQAILRVLAAGSLCAVALFWLRLRQTLAGGTRASRA
jgi:hypothetical protein